MNFSTFDKTKRSTRVKVVEDRRRLEEQKSAFVRECEQKKKDAQNLILGKKTPSGVKGLGL